MRPMEEPEVPQTPGEMWYEDTRTFLALVKVVDSDHLCDQMRLR